MEGKYKTSIGFAKRKLKIFFHFWGDVGVIINFIHKTERMQIQHNALEASGVFFIKGDRGVISELIYQKSDSNVLTIDHTETKIPQEGKGLASKLVAHIVKYARENGFTIFPLCPFAEVQFDRNLAYHDVLAQ